MTELLSQPVEVKAGTEKEFISQQRGEIVDLYERLQEEEQRKKDIQDKVKAFREIKRRTTRGPGTQEQKL